MKKHYPSIYQAFVEYLDRRIISELMSLSCVFIGFYISVRIPFIDIAKAISEDPHNRYSVATNRFLLSSASLIRKACI